MSLNGKFLDKDHLQYFWTKIKMKFASAEQGSKADTAVQPSDMETALSDKQDTISDLQTIRSGAASGATAVQPSDMESALADKQDVIADLDAIRSGATAGNTALQPGDIDTLPTDGSSNPVSSGGTYNFVNSSIATNTAYFIGTFASVAELEAYTGTVTNNDYAFVTSTDSAGNTLYNRYKYNAAIQTWSFEYAVNNTSFTTAQWAAIQSGMTSADKTKLDGIEQGATKTVIDTAPTSGSSNAVSSGGVYTALSGKQDTIADLSDIRSGASAGATAVQPSALTDYQTKLSGTNKLDPAYIEYDATHRAVTDTEKSTWNGKQDTISDLSTIRSGAAAGATALQQSDVTSTYSSSGTAPVNGTAVSDALGTLEVEIGDIANRGAKNKVDATTHTTTGSEFVLEYVAMSLPAGSYVFSYTSDQLTTGDIQLVIRNGVTVLGRYTITSRSGRNVIPFSIDSDADNLRLYTVRAGTYSDFMLCTAADYAVSPAFVPYALPNTVLTPSLIEQVDEGAKNLFDYDIIGPNTTNIGTSVVSNGVRFTMNSDKSVTISRESASSQDAYVWFRNSDGSGVQVTDFCDDVHIFSGAAGASASTYMLFINNINGSGTYKYFGEGEIIGVPRVTPNAAGISISAGYSPSNLVIKPMICTAADWAVSQKFVPYAPTNRELYDMIQALQNNS